MDNRQTEKHFREHAERFKRYAEDAEKSARIFRASEKDFNEKADHYARRAEIEAARAEAGTQAVIAETSSAQKTCRHGHHEDACAYCEREARTICGGCQTPPCPYCG